VKSDIVVMYKFDKFCNNQFLPTSETIWLCNQSGLVLHGVVG